MQFLQSQLVSAIRYTINATDSDSRCYALAAVKIEVVDKVAPFIATDGRRLHGVERVPCEAENGEWLLPYDAAKFIANLPTSNGKNTTIEFSGLKVTVSGFKGTRTKAVETVGSFDIIEGRFPDWRQVLPHGDARATIAGDCDNLHASFNPDVLGLRFKVGSLGRLFGTFNSADYPTAELTRQPVTVSGDFDATLNPSYMAAAIPNVEKVACRVSQYGPGQPIRVEFANCFAVVMPQR